MKQEDLLDCIAFFNKLTVKEIEVTTDEEQAGGYKTVYVDYTFENNTYRTKKLFYRATNRQEYIFNNQGLEEYFGIPVYWLDIEKHDWPHGKGAEIEQRVIKDMIDGENPAFENLLKQIANNSYNGFLQKITKDGRSQQYGFNLTNNNHWHDLIKLIKYVIQSKGQSIPMSYFKPLIFKWLYGKRQSLSPQFGDRAIVFRLLEHIKNIQPRLSQMTNIENLIKIIQHKRQIILQGPPGTGKTFTAKDLAEQMILDNISEDKAEQKKRLDASGQFQLIQFHPSYSYEDFVRGITVKNDNEQIEYVTENKVLAGFAENACQNKEKAYILLIDEINRANLPSVLGELIYALEYRGEAVESMYAIDGNRKLILPKNLYIIGTMNTADRSVGHIDYAIRRRFAFIDMLPNAEVIELDKAKALFEKVSELFVKDGQASEYLAPDFNYQEVQLGHSYFMATDEEELNLKLKYEIIPILREYLKDGILLDKARERIEQLKNF